MKHASIRDLRYRFPEVERLPRAGETVEITRRGHLVGRLSPAQCRTAEAPDIMARLHGIYGDTVMAVSNDQLPRRDRGER